MSGKYIPSLAALALLATASAGHAAVVISQVYGSGGNSGAIYTNDFIELFNSGAAPVNLSGWSVQYASAAGGTWSNSTPLSGSIPAHGYYLVMEAQGSGSIAALPTPDAVGTTALSGMNGKLALVTSITLLNGSCPTGNNIVSFVGYGTANCYEGAGAAAAATNSTAQIRRLEGCMFSNNNSADFAIGTPTPRNSGSPMHACGGGTPISIMQIQGQGVVSPLAGSTVTTSGTVTAIRSYGFFIQDPVGDADATTSDAIYVYQGVTPTVAVGNSVTVTGVVSNVYVSTELDSPSIVNNGAGVMPKPVILDNNPPSADPTTGICANPAITAADGLQANNFACLDGMVVTMNDAIVTGATYSGGDAVHQGTPGGFYATLASQPRPYRAVGAVYPGLGGSIPVWNGEPEILLINYAGVGFSPTGFIYNAGTRFSVTGVIQGFHLSSINQQDAYRIYPVSMTTNTAVPTPTYPQPVKDSAVGTLTIGTQNLQYFFNNTADGADTSAYTDTCTGTGVNETCPTAAQYAIRLKKMSKQVREVLKSPVVMGVQQIENYPTLTDLTNQIYADSGNTITYQPFTIPGNDSSGINLGLLVLNDVVVNSVTQLYRDTTTTNCSSGTSCLLNARPPLLLDATFNGYHFNLLVIHNFSSGSVGLVGYDYVGHRRVEQAVQVASIAQALQSGGTLVGVGDARQNDAGVITPGPFNITGDVNVPLIVAGVFNAYQFTDGYVDVTGMINGAAVQAQNQYWDMSGSYVAPSPSLVDSGIRSDPAQRYTYNSRGDAEELDQVLLSRRGWKDFVSVSNAHGNSDVSAASITDTTPIVLDETTAARSASDDGQVLTIAIDRIFTGDFDAPLQ
ncbi:MAG: lamin tail domain-containing protein [Rudaea sp.]